MTCMYLRGSNYFRHPRDLAANALQDPGTDHSERPPFPSLVDQLQLAPSPSSSSLNMTSKQWSTSTFLEASDTQPTALIILNTPLAHDELFRQIWAAGECAACTALSSFGR